MPCSLGYSALLRAPPQSMRGSRRRRSIRAISLELGFRAFGEAARGKSCAGQESALVKSNGFTFFEQRVYVNVTRSCQGVLSVVSTQAGQRSIFAAADVAATAVFVSGHARACNVGI